MKLSVSPRRIGRHVVKSLGVLFILTLVVLAYAATALTCYAAKSFTNSTEQQCFYKNSNGSCLQEGVGPLQGSTPPDAAACYAKGAGYVYRAGECIKQSKG